MFTPREVTFLKNSLRKYIEKAQQQLESLEVEGSKRLQLESRLITTASILNKLEHTQPEPSNIVKSKEVRILIVDDVESMRKIHRHYFMECGFRVVDLAEDGQRAMLLLQKAFENEKPYDLIISDWEMPKMSGLELLKKVRTDKKLWRTPLYLISGLSDKKYIMKGINLGATGYMVKPINHQMVKQKFSDYLA